MAIVKKEDWPFSVNTLYRWHVNGRYEYWAIDLYIHGPGRSENGEWQGSDSIIVPRLAKKYAQEICNKLNQSLALGGMLYREP